MMNISLSVVSALDVALLAIGTGLGLLVGYFAFPIMRQAKRLRAELEQLRQEHETYKADVKEHFRQTADLVGEMTRTYATVYDHLAGGARRFCGDALDDNALVFGASLAALTRTNGGTSPAEEVVLIEEAQDEEEEECALGEADPAGEEDDLPDALRDKRAVN